MDKGYSADHMRLDSSSRCRRGPHFTARGRDTQGDPGPQRRRLLHRAADVLLGRTLRHSDAGFYKQSLFRRGKGRFECRLKDQDTSMCDMEVHEHVVVDGKIGMLSNPLLHHNCDSLSRYIHKHDSYSNWEAGVWVDRNPTELPPSLFA